MPDPRRRLVCSALLAVLLAGCSGGASLVATTQPPTSIPSLTAVPQPSASLPPASATISFGGGVTGVAPGMQIDCDNPSLGGLVITLFGSTTTKDVSTTISLSPRGVSVTLDSGSGTTFTARTFSGTGVTGFDATKGTQLDGALTEAASASNPGSLPAITSIKGSVDCGNQMPGSSTLSLSGTVPDGAVSGPVDPIRVDCNPNATPATVHAVGVIKVGATPILLVFQATSAGFTAFLAPTTTTKQHFFMTTDRAAATISPTGAHVSGTAAESGTTDSLQISGDLVCGVVNP